MGIKTEDFAHNLPPKEMTTGVDFLKILDEFNPKELDERFLNECARRNSYFTCYKWAKDGLALIPIEERIEMTKNHISFTLNELNDYVSRINKEGLNKSLYKNARERLIKAIGAKGALEYNLKEYERLSVEERIKQKEAYQKQQEQFELNRETSISYQELDSLVYYDNIQGLYSVSMHEKVIKIRKGFLASNGKPLIQRDFAKLIDYPINKYTEAEKTDSFYYGEKESIVEYKLLEKLIMIAHANPYWLFDKNSFADDAVYKLEEYQERSDQATVYATPDIILKWIQEGKPQDTKWYDAF